MIYSVSIHGKGRLGADGIAFWYQERPNTIGNFFGNTEHFNGLGIILDTYDNDGTVKPNSYYNFKLYF